MYFRRNESCFFKEKSNFEQIYTDSSLVCFLFFFENTLQFHTFYLISKSLDIIAQWATLSRTALTPNTVQTKPWITNFWKMRRYGGYLSAKTLDYPKPWRKNPGLPKTLAYFAQNLGVFCKPWLILLKTLAYFTQNLGFPVTRTDMGVFGLKPWKTLDYENSGRDRSDCRDSVVMDVFRGFMLIVAPKAHLRSTAKSHPPGKLSS